MIIIDGRDTAAPEDEKDFLWPEASVRWKLQVRTGMRCLKKFEYNTFRGRVEICLFSEQCPSSCVKRREWVSTAPSVNNKD